MYSWVLRIPLFFLMGSRSYFKPSKIPLKYETRLSWYAFSFEVHACIIASRDSTAKLSSAGERLSEIVDKQTRHSGVQRGQFDGNSFLFPSNRPLWTPQCRLLLVDNLTQPLPSRGTFCRRNAARNDSCVHFK